ncbi:MAG TPA: HAMP domain-containing sensor histidine kinase, partial [Steroidobacteraceae bacterium]|nr:HAMP domain-containing sensor histidine kinase [Steroidobacteraceae bacterium]
MYAAITAISFVVLFGVIFWSTTRFMRHQIDDSVSSEIDEIRTDARGMSQPQTESLVRDLAKHSSGFSYLLQDRNGVARAGNLPALDPQLGIREWSVPAAQRSSARASIRGQGVSLGEDYLFVGWSTHQLHEMEEMVIGTFVWGFAAAIALALAGGFIMSGRLLRKIQSISDTSRNIVETDLSRRIPLSEARDEFDNLSTSVNSMLDRIQALMSDLSQVTTDIAHDMRTPLTRLRQRLELAQRSEVDAASLRAALASTVREIDSILEIFAALLRIAQIESGARSGAYRQVDLNEVISTVAELYRPSAEDRQQTLSEQLSADVSVNGDRELLMQLFANLTQNAVLHCPAGSKIVLLTRQSERGPQVLVADNGSGIPAEMRDKVLQRFFRLEKSRTTPGNGLGLSLAAAIVKLHDASMSFSDNGPGLRVTVSFAHPRPAPD